MPPITTTEQLIECFDEAEPAEQIKVLKRVDIPISEFEKLATWNDDDYSRNCVVRKKEFEIILICWDVETTTPIHDHDGQDCWVLQVSGSIIEKRYQETEDGFTITHEANLKEGNLSYMNDRMGYHTLENNSNSRAMTLHVYANPIEKCKVYNEEKSLFEVKELVYDTVHKIDALSVAVKK
ncbi:MAG: cysteine dioxygenase family protein [Flavobacteriales bacterium]|nr:cysteine dioxygenase family protein [Flavobacteriales bacterium]